MMLYSGRIQCYSNVFMKKLHPTFLPSSPRTLQRRRALTTGPSHSEPHVEKENDSVALLALQKEHRMVHAQVRFFTRQLYRRILRSIHQLLRPGNAFDESEFQKREEKQAKDNAEPLSLIDALPVDRQEELQSRTDYYWQYTRENFTQHSDLLQDVLAPRAKGSTSLYSASSSNSAAWDMDQRQREREAELMLQDQLDTIERYFYLLQQGEVHRQWLLRDMKFPNDPYKPPLESAEQVALFKGQFQQYIVRVLQFNYQLPEQWSKGLLDIATPTEDYDSRSGDEPLMWSDEEEEDDNLR